MRIWLLSLCAVVWLLEVDVQAGYEYLDAPNAVVNQTSGASPVIDWSQGRVQVVTLTAATVTFSFVPPKVHEPLTLIVVQDGTGLRVVVFPALVKCTATVCTAATTTAGKATLYEFIWDGTTYWNTAISLNL